MSNLFAIDKEAGGAIEIYANELCDRMSPSPEIVDYSEVSGDRQALCHYAVWYLYRDRVVEQRDEKTLVTIHHLQRWNETMEEIANRKISLVTMSSEWFRFLQTRVNKDRVSIVPHGVNPEEWPLRKRVVASKKFNIGIVGRCYPDGRKGERLVPHIVNQLPEGKFRISIVGVGWEKIINKLQACNVDVEYQESVSFDELKAFCADFDVFLCTSDLEGGPLPLLETMSLGITPVSSPVGLSRDLLAGTGLGYLFPKGNAAACARILSKLISGKYPMISPERLRAAATHLSWENAARGYEALYSAIEKGIPLPSDPTNYFEWLAQLRGNRRLRFDEKVALASNPAPTDRWTQPRVWRAWNKFARLFLGTWA
ncbi:MAG: glycosyltransferase family 4 protein [Planctomycetaceae bacterium]|nr:glycosyltransferase family 4 protein [Planctomycetaceae bacterium]